MDKRHRPFFRGPGIHEDRAEASSVPWIPSPVNLQGQEESGFGEGRGEPVMSSVWDSSIGMGGF